MGEKQSMLGFGRGKLLAQGLLICGLTANAVVAQDFRILDLQLNPQGKILVNHPSDAVSYFVLYRGRGVLQITQAVDIALGQSNTGQLSDSALSLSNLAAYYVVGRIPTNSSLDLDSDGIPDVWELQHGLGPLNAVDAAQIKPGDTRTWLQFYYDQIPAIANFVTNASTTLVTAGLTPIQVNFSKPFSGILRVQLGGTALFGADYTLPGITLISANPLIVAIPILNQNTSAFIPISPANTPTLDPDRTVTLSLVSPANNAYQLSAAGPVTHTLRMTESSLASGGLLSGTLSTTNAVFLEPQPLRVAIRAGGVGQLVAYFDTSRAPFFGGPFTLTALHTPNGLQFQGQATATLPATGAPPGQTARWTLNFPQSSTDTNGVITAQFRLDLVGLTASGRTNTALGTITFAPLN